FEYNFLNISSVGNETLLGNDETSGDIDIEFPFPFFGQTYSQLRVNSNGVVLLGDMATFPAFPDCSEDNGLPDTSIMILYQDLNPFYLDSFFTYHFDSCPLHILGSTSCFVVMYDNYHSNNFQNEQASQTATFEA